jgi:hypothetical protein
MPVTIGFQGLCAIVSEKQDVASSATLDVLLVDTAKAGLNCAHEPQLFLPAAGLADPDKLTVPASGGRKLLSLAGRQVHILPGGKMPKAIGFKAAALHSVPEMKQACGIGTVDSDCFANPPQVKPIAGRIELPSGGKLFSERQSLTTNQWSFAPKVREDVCYHGFFAWEVLFELPEANSIVLDITTLAGDPEGQLTLQASSGKLAVNNICMTEAPRTPSNDTLVYYQLLDPPFSGANRPMTRSSSNCTIPKGNAPGIGCVPFLMSRT